MSLREYARKRNFSRTAEPAPSSTGTKAGSLRFVIQKHDASRLHYDFRLELDGTLKSWAVPKGVPLKKGEKRLAMQVEDHPIDYADFEGIIPKGEYGGGTVMVWDRGWYEPLSDHPARDLHAGKLHVLLHGTKLEGEWALVHIRAAEDNEWLLIKIGEDARPISKNREDSSVVSNRSMQEIAEDQDRTWNSNRAIEPKGAGPKKLKASPAPKKFRARTSTRKGAQRPVFIEPMKAKLVKAPPNGSGWAFELKFDGYRALAIKEGNAVSLRSRNEKNFDARFPEIADAVAALPAESLVLDGEIVALDKEGRSSFQLLQGAAPGSDTAPILYYVFDLLHLDGESLLDLPLAERRKRLESLISDPPELIRFSAELGHDPAALLKAVKARGLEGILGKRVDSRYEPGLRTGSWIKIKCINEQEFVIGGFTPPAGSRACFGALLVGYYEKERLRFAGKVGTGFSDKLLRDLFRRFSGSRTDQCPFADLPEKKSGKWTQGITPSMMRKIGWVRPEMVCQVRFTEWTNDGKLRHPSFVGMREDKRPTEITREAV